MFVEKEMGCLTEAHAKSKPWQFAITHTLVHRQDGPGVSSTQAPKCRKMREHDRFIGPEDYSQCSAILLTTGIPSSRSFIWSRSSLSHQCYLLTVFSQAAAESTMPQ